MDWTVAWVLFGYDVLSFSFFLSLFLSFFLSSFLAENAEPVRNERGMGWVRRQRHRWGPERWRC